MTDKNTTTETIVESEETKDARAAKKMATGLGVSTVTGAAAGAAYAAGGKYAAGRIATAVLGGVSGVALGYTLFVAGRSALRWNKARRAAKKAAKAAQPPAAQTGDKPASEQTAA